MKVGSLFSGIGGFDLGLERAGMETAWFCEQDNYCRKVLARHWPGKPIYPDVCTLEGSEVEPVEILCGGFPCQDLSVAGKGAGLAGERSGLWSEFARLIGELRPRYVLVENVPALLGRGFGIVLADLAALGYDTEWDCLPASAFGAPHQRDRLWLVAYPGSPSSGMGEHRSSGQAWQPARTSQPAVVRQKDGTLGSERLASCSGASVLPDSDDAGRSEQWRSLAGRTEHPPPELGGRWPLEPGVGRVVDGFPGRVDRLRALGNALVPQIAEWIGHRIVEWEHGKGRPTP